MKDLFTHWGDNNGTEFFIDMAGYVAVSSAERATINEALRGAAEFAEANLKIGQGRTVMTQSKPRPAGNLQAESTDLWYGVGGHTGFAKALLKKVNVSTFEMEFEYRLEDFFTFGGKGFFPGFHQWHLKALAHDFLVSGVLERKYTWTIGKFNGKV